MEYKLIQFFKGVHTNDTAIICARGPSMMKQIANPILKKIKTIGINHIESDGFTPTYLLSADGYKLDRAKPYKKYLTNTNAEHFFTYHDIPSAKQIRYEMGGIGLDGPNNIGGLLDNNILFRYKTSTIPAIALAIYMGFKYIGILGFDLSKDHPMHYLVGNIDIACQQIRTYCDNHKIKIYNLSKESPLKAFQKMRLKTFYKKYHGGAVS